jgi:1-acyl-sn-glycerol-3-phosphate acyltransferase
MAEKITRESADNIEFEPPAGATDESGSLLGDIAWRIWAVWVVCLFIVSMIIFLIPFLAFCYFLPDTARVRRFNSFSRVWMSIFLPLAGCPMRVRGKEKFQKGQTYVVVCNHNALLDVPVSTPGIPGGNKTIAKIEMARIPVFGLIYRTGSVIVDRKSEASRRESFLRMRQTLEQGLHMCLYPEGTRNKTGQPLKTFHDGAFRLSLSTGKAIVPAIIFNTKKVMPPEKPFYFKPHRLGMHFLDPIVPEPVDNVETLKKRVFDIMWNYYIANA